MNSLQLQQNLCVCVCVSNNWLIPNFGTGVSDIQADVAAKTVVVQADESVSPQDMLAKLQAVRSCRRILCQT